jgi:hypothetical protein
MSCSVSTRSLFNSFCVMSDRAKAFQPIHDRIRKCHLDSVTHLHPAKEGVSVRHERFISTFGAVSHEDKQMYITPNDLEQWNALYSAIIMMGFGILTNYPDDAKKTNDWMPVITSGLMIEFGDAEHWDDSPTVEELCGTVVWFLNHYNVVHDVCDRFLLHLKGPREHQESILRKYLRSSYRPDDDDQSDLDDHDDILIARETALVNDLNKWIDTKRNHESVKQTGLEAYVADVHGPTFHPQTNALDVRVSIGSSTLATISTQTRSRSPSQSPRPTSRPSHE